MIDMEKLQDYHSLGKKVGLKVGDEVLEGVLTDVSIEYTGQVNDDTMKPIGIGTVSILTDNNGKFTNVDADRVVFL